MTERSEARPFRRDWKVVAGAVLLGAPVGVGVAIFGFVGWVIGPLVVIFGLVGRARGQVWAAWILWFGVGLTLGALIYIGGGVLTPDGPSSGGGSGHR